MSATLDLGLKRGFDVMVSVAAIMVLAPVFAAIALVIRLDSPGPILFRHVRCGHGGRPFVCFKFRTMTFGQNSTAGADEYPAPPSALCKVPRDPRITPVGFLLRKTSLDELPQLWNVLRGDMSIVGPRPVPEAELRWLYGEHAATVTSVKPGLTGLWQVSGRSLLSHDERVALDLLYVAGRTFVLDCAIVVRTLSVVVRGYGAM